MLYGQARGGLDQASTRQEEKFMTRDLCHVVSWPGDGTTWGGRGGLGVKWVSDGDIGEKEAGSMVNVQCLIGPLLWVTESETLKKAERITSKDLSERDDTSSVVIPFVSIFGRIFNLMVPGLNCFSFRR